MTQNIFHDANNELFHKSEYLSLDSSDIRNGFKEIIITYNCYDYVETDTQGHRKLLCHNNNKNSLYDAVLIVDVLSF